MATGTPTTKFFQERLEDLISNSGKDIRELSKEIGISAGALSNYQNDKAAPSINALKKIADYFGVSCDYLLGKAENRTADNEAVFKRFGLTDKAILSLERSNRRPESLDPTLKTHLPFLVQNALNAILCSDQFSAFLLAVNSAMVYSGEIWQEIESEDYGSSMTLDLSGADTEDERQAFMDSFIERGFLKQSNRKMAEQLVLEHLGRNTEVIDGITLAKLKIYEAEQQFSKMLYSLPGICEFK